MRLFLKIVFIEARPEFSQETKRFASVKDCSRFSALCDLPETLIKKVTYAYPFRYFWRCKIDEILTMSFYPWFSV